MTGFEVLTVRPHSTWRLAHASMAEAHRLAAVRSRIDDVLRAEVRDVDTGDLVAVYENGEEVTTNGSANPPRADVR